jgi:hypothetical protein|tara:strand:- start:1124 stop:1744 length:621 start_codon:yes stop_codon:yes gene_type:complete
LKNIRLLVLILYLLNPLNLKATDFLNDEDYYQKGIDLYKDAQFSEAFIVFFNLSEKGDTNSQFNLSNMYSSGIGTTQDYKEALKYSWLCALGGEKKCSKKIAKLIKKLDEKSIEEMSGEVEKILKNELYKEQDILYALKLGFWYEKFSPIVDVEQAYVWYSVSVTGGLYKAMKVRDKVGEKIDADKIIELQSEANKIYTKVKYFVN